jgi:16S rRNA (uracil1498-N3)-methyltransferase
MLQRIVVDLVNIRPPEIFLSPDQRHYLSRVLRLQVGDRFLVMDGQGNTWLACLQDGGNSLNAQILEPVETYSELPVTITLVIAIPKGNGFDDVVRQVTELGVAVILPVISDRTLIRPSAHKLDRWRRIAQEAAEQSERQFVPVILEPISFSNHLQRFDDSLGHSQEKSIPDQRYLCVTRRQVPQLLDCLLESNLLENSLLESNLLENSLLENNLLESALSESALSKSISLSSFSRSMALSVAIGPEGGWTDAEISQAIAAGYHPVSLGQRILRTVTAPVVALSLIAATCERRYD